MLRELRFLFLRLYSCAPYELSLSLSPSLRCALEWMKPPPEFSNHVSLFFIFTLFLCFSYSLWILIGNYNLGFRVCLFFLFFFFCFFVGKRFDLLYIGQRIGFFFFWVNHPPCEFLKEWSSTCQFLKGAFLLTCQHLIKSFCFYILYMIRYMCDNGSQDSELNVLFQLEV